MKSLKLGAFAFLVFGLALGALAVQPAEARVGTGEATGLDVQATEEGELVGLTVNITEAHVAESSVDSFDVSDTVISLNAVGGAITSDELNAATRHEPLQNSVESRSSASNLFMDLDLLTLSLLDLNSDTIASLARIDGTCGSFSATGDTTIQNLTLSILGESVAANLSATPGPNAVLLDSVITVDLVESTLTADVFVILNEQTVAGDQSSIAVNGLRIYLGVTVTDDLTDSVLLNQTVDTTVADSRAEFSDCNGVDLGLEKTTDLGGANAVIDEPFEYTVVITELSGTADATAVEFTDTLPAEVTFDAFTGISGGGECSHDTGTISCQWLTIPAGSSATVSYQVTPNTVTDPESVSNFAVVATADDDTDDSNNSDSVDVVIEDVPLGDADLQLSKTAEPNPATVGGSLAYTLVVTNNGPADAENVVVSDTLDASLKINGVSATGGGTCTETGQQLSCSWGLIVNGGSETVSVATTPTEAGIVSNAAVAVSDNPDPDGAEDSVDVEVVEPSLGDADLQLSKTAEPNPATVGGSLSYTLVVTNNGPEDAENVVVSDSSLYASLVVERVNASDGGSCNIIGHQVRCKWVVVTDGQVVHATIETAPTEAGTMRNTAKVVADNSDPDLASAEAEVVVLVEEEQEVAPPSDSGDASSIPVMSHAGLVVLVMLTLGLGLLAVPGYRS